MDKLGSKVTEKQYKLAEKVLAGETLNKTVGDVMMSVGYAPSTIDRNQTKIFSSQGFQNALVALGATPEKILTPALDALQATQTTAYQGEITETNVPDHKIRMQGADQLAEFLGIKKQIVENRNINVNVEFQDIAELFDD